MNSHHKFRRQFFIMLVAAVSMICCSLTLLCAPSYAATTPEAQPELLDSSVSPGIALAGDKIKFSASWRDRGHENVSSKVRFRKRDDVLSSGEHWRVSELLARELYSGYEEFHRELTVPGQVGTYEFEVQLTWDVDGENIENSWVPGGSFVLVPRTTQEGRRCLGAHNVPRILDGGLNGLEIIGPQIVEERSRLTLTLGGLEDEEASVYWCVSRGVLYDLAFQEGSWRVNFQAPFYIDTRHTIEAEVFVKAGDSYGIASKSISLIDTTEGENSDPAPEVASVFVPSRGILGEYSSVRFEVVDFNEKGNETTGDLISRFYLSVDGGANFQELRREIMGTGDGPGQWAVAQTKERSRYGNVGSISWRAAIECSRCQILVESTDGRSVTKAYSNYFAVGKKFMRLYAGGFVLDTNGGGLSDVTVGMDELEQEVRTDNLGYFSFKIQDEGVYRLRPQREGYDFEPPHVDVTLSRDLSLAEEVVFRAVPVQEPALIDVKPGSTINPINLRSQGTIPVAILSSSDFDASNRVNFTSLSFGRTGNEDSLHYRGNDEPNCEPEDVNDDGLLDLVCHFEALKAAFQQDDSVGILRGLTTDGEEFEGRDRITIVGQGHDDDADGADDEMEDDAPNNGDGNNDGLPDSAQANVTSFVTASGKYITLVSSAECTNRNVQVVSPKDLPADPTYSAPEGFFRFELEGCASSDTTVFFHSGTDYSNAEYRRFGPTHADATAHWYTLPTFFSAADINGQVVTTASFLLEDGGQGDDDLTANGVIVDPGGPAMLSAPFDIPTLSYAALALLAVLLGSVAAFFLRR